MSYWSRASSPKQCRLKRRHTYPVPFVLDFCPQLWGGKKEWLINMNAGEWSAFSKRFERVGYVCIGRGTQNARGSEQSLKSTLSVPTNFFEWTLPLKNSLFHFKTNLNDLENIYNRHELTRQNQNPRIWTKKHDAVRHLQISNEHLTFIISTDSKIWKAD